MSAALRSKRATSAPSASSAAAKPCPEAVRRLDQYPSRSSAAGLGKCRDQRETELWFRGHPGADTACGIPAAESPRNQDSGAPPLARLQDGQLPHLTHPKGLYSDESDSSVGLPSYSMPTISSRLRCSSSRLSLVRPRPPRNVAHEQARVGITLNDEVEAPHMLSRT
jgi:hypothetical protein